MRRPCKICWLILGLFLVGNLVLLGVWWRSNKDRRRPEKQTYNKDDRRGRMREFLIDKAGVDDRQFEEMYTLWTKHSELMRNSQYEVDSLRKVLMDKTFSVENDEAKVELLLDQLAQKQRWIEKANYHHFRKMRQVCKTDQQREMLDKMFRTHIQNKGPHKRRRGRDRR